MELPTRITTPSGVVTVERITAGSKRFHYLNIPCTVAQKACIPIGEHSFNLIMENLLEEEQDGADAKKENGTEPEATGGTG